LQRKRSTLLDSRAASLIGESAERLRANANYLLAFPAVVPTLTGDQKPERA